MLARGSVTHEVDLSMYPLEGLHRSWFKEKLEFTRCKFHIGVRLPIRRDSVQRLCTYGLPGHAGSRSPTCYARERFLALDVDSSPSEPVPRSITGDDPFSSG